MERLTKKFTDGTFYCEDIEDVGIEGINAPTYVGKAVNKLADYEDAEEQGLLLRLPCKVGDKVYKVWYKPCHLGETIPDSFDCICCNDKCDLKLAIFECKVDSLTFIINEFVLTNKNTVYFLTKEEAEKALADMKGV